MKNCRLIFPLLALLAALSSPLALAEDAAIKVNINTADAVTLAESLEGVGSQKAQAIIAYRNAHGDFKSLDELLEVKGIGPAILAKNQQLLSLE